MPQKLIYPTIKELSKIEKTLTDFLEKMEADFENVKEQLQNAKRVFFEKFYFDKEKWAVLPFCNIYTNFDGSWRSLKMNADEVEITCDDSSCELKIDENNLWAIRNTDNSYREITLKITTKPTTQRVLSISYKITAWLSTKTPTNAVNAINKAFDEPFITCNAGQRVDFDIRMSWGGTIYGGMDKHSRGTCRFKSQPYGDARMRFTYTAPSNAKNGDVNVCRIWTNDGSSVTAIVPVLII